jgi:hypothetical protein
MHFLDNSLSTHTCGSNQPILPLGLLERFWFVEFEVLIKRAFYSILWITVLGASHDFVFAPIFSFHCSRTAQNQTTLHPQKPIWNSFAANELIHL